MKKQFNATKVRKHLTSLGFKIEGLSVHGDRVTGRFVNGIDFFATCGPDEYAHPWINWPSIGSNTPIVGARILGEWHLQAVAVAMLSTMTE